MIGDKGTVHLSCFNNGVRDEWTVPLSARSKDMGRSRGKSELFLQALHQDPCGGIEKMPLNAPVHAPIIYGNV